MTLQQEVKEEVLRQLRDSDWQTLDEVCRQVGRHLIDNPAYWDMMMQDFRIAIYAAVQQALISLALAGRMESTKDGRIRIKPTR